MNIDEAKALQSKHDKSKSGTSNMVEFIGFAVAGVIVLSIILVVFSL